MNFSFVLILLIILAAISVLPYMNAVYLFENNNDNKAYYYIACTNIALTSISLLITIILHFPIYSLNADIFSWIAFLLVILIVINNILSLITTIILIVENHKEPQKIIPAFIYLGIIIINTFIMIINPQSRYFYQVLYKYFISLNKIHNEPNNTDNTDTLPVLSKTL